MAYWMGLSLYVSLILIAASYGIIEETSDLKEELSEVKVRVKRHMREYRYMPRMGINPSGRDAMAYRRWDGREGMHPHGLDILYGMSHNGPRNQNYDDGRFGIRGDGMHHGGGFGVLHGRSYGMPNGGGPGMRNGGRPGMRNGGGPGMRNGGGPGMRNGGGPGMRNGGGPGLRNGGGPGMYHNGGYGNFQGQGYGMHHRRGYGGFGMHHMGRHGMHHFGGHGMHHWGDGNPHGGVFPVPDRDRIPYTAGRPNEMHYGRVYGGISHGSGYHNPVHRREDYLGNHDHGFNSQGTYEGEGHESDSWMRNLDPGTGLPRLSIHERRTVNFLSTAQNHFTVNLHRQICPPVTDIVYSPYGIFQALTMMYIGSRGHTAFQMRRVLHLMGMGRHVHHPVRYQNILLSNPGSAVVEVANNLMMKPERNVSEIFLDRLESNYEAHVFHFDLTHEDGPEAPVNELVSEQTHALIPRILNPGMINENTDMVLINAMYFKAKWRIPFIEERTSSESFMKTATEQTLVEMMGTEGWFKAGTVPDHAARVLELPYEGDRFSMLVILPDDTEGLAILEDGLTTEILATSLEAALPARVNVSLPKFRLNSSLSLKEKLENMGMTKAFDARFADFRGISNDNGLHITDIIHRTIVDVDEEGSEEAPSTPATMSDSSDVPPTSDFRCDHPFLFIIRDNVSKVNLFIGKFSGDLR